MLYEGELGLLLAARSRFAARPRVLLTLMMEIHSEMWFGASACNLERNFSAVSVFLEERIFRPLRMTDTMFWAEAPDQRARLATVYGPGGAGQLVRVETETVPFTERPTLIEGAGEDLCQELQAMARVRG